MKGINYNYSAKWLTVIAIFVLMINPSFGSDGDQIVIVKSSDNHYYDKSIKTLINTIEGPAQYKIIEADEVLSSGAIIETADILINLGINAIKSNHQISENQKNINTYFTSEQYSGLNQSPNQHRYNIFLDQPLDRYIALSQFLLNPSSIGLLNSSAIDFGGETLKLLQERSTGIAQYHPDNRDLVLPKLRVLLQKNDLLLLLPDNRIINQDTLKGILLTTYRKLKPVISYSPAHVKSGALASIYSSPSDIGRHIADVINQLRSNSAAIPETNQPARYYSIVLNDHVAHALDIKLPDIELIRQYIDGILP
jgi:putative ABC transport system substrate-binding protein